MTTQQVVALFVICLFIIGLFAYAYFLGKKAGRANHPTGLLFDSPPRAGHSRPTSVSLQISASEGSGHDMTQAIRDAIPASLREVSSIDAQKTKSLCCEAAGIIHPLSSPAEALIPHDKLREAAPVDATLIAKNRPHAQPAEGYTHPSAVSCIVAAMDATLTDQAGTYATSEQMAQAIEAALQQAGFLSPTDDSWQVVRARLDESLVDREAEQRKHHHTVANLKRTITELEERIMSYTGLAVTKSDYALLMETSRTLRVAEQTMKALKSQVANQAAEQAAGVQAIAKRVHAQLRSTATTTARTEVAA
ncbi:hypothetical protein SAMN05216185_103442 [Pseudomonas guariconensis]|uniref:hypothetical protein n=1 Tax=Pseudomonas guariconensis TaxID=1288410 RepID=UPI0008915995|nr:hypothetical protein [Pseudomonas guariconensis]SDC63118.1 hypothetical protein SAMN05216185_103442 [Pseudomonas guariconensis]